MKVVIEKIWPPYIKIGFDFSINDMWSGFSVHLCPLFALDVEYHYTILRGLCVTLDIGLLSIGFDGIKEVENWPHETEEVTSAECGEEHRPPR